MFLASGRLRGAWTILLLLLCALRPVFGQPDNDHFAHRIRLAGEALQFEAYSFGASLESGEPEHSNHGVRSVWYSWTAPADGRVVLRMVSRLNNPGFAVFSGTDLGRLSKLVSVFADASHFFDVKAGTEYQLVFFDSAISNSRGGLFSVSLDFGGVPANDHFASAQDIGSGMRLHGHVINATEEPGEPETWLEGTVWFKWTAPESGFYRFTNTQTSPQVFVGTTFQDLRALHAYNYEFRVEGGASYWMQVTSFSPRFDIGIERIAAEVAPNDDFARATFLEGTSIRVPIESLKATVQIEEEYAGEVWSGTLWHRWIAPADGTLSAFLQSSDGLVEFFSGRSLEEAVKIGGYSTRSWWRGEGLRAAKVASGQEIMIQVPAPWVTFSETPWRSRLDIEFVPAQPNHSFATRAELSGSSGQRSIALAPTFFDFQGSADGPAALWHGWRAPGAGTVLIELSPEVAPGPNELHAILAGALWRVDQDGLHASEPFERFGTAEAAASVKFGEQLAISVAGLAPGNSERARAVLKWRWFPLPENDDWEQAAELSGGEVLFRGTNWNATSQSTDPNPFNSAFYGRTNTVWWKWTAPEDGWVWLDSAMYFGAFPCGPPWTNGPGPLGLKWASPSFSVTAGSTWCFAAAGRLAFPVQPELEGFSAELRLATLSMASPLDGAVLTGPQKIEFRPPAGLPVVAIALVRYEWLALDRNAQALAPSLLTELTHAPFAFETNLATGVYIVRSVIVLANGQTILSKPAFFRLKPANDDRFDGFWIEGRRIEVPCTTSGATSQAGENVVQGSSTVWYRWQAPGSGLVQVSGPGEVTLWQGSLRVRRDVNRFIVRAGEVYEIQVVSSASLPGESRSSQLFLEQRPVELVGPEWIRVRHGETALVRIAVHEPAENFVESELRSSTVGTLAKWSGPPPSVYEWTNAPLGWNSIEVVSKFTSGEQATSWNRAVVVYSANISADKAQVISGDDVRVEGIQPTLESHERIFFRWVAPRDGYAAFSGGNDIRSENMFSESLVYCNSHLGRRAGVTGGREYLFSLAAQAETQLGIRLLPGCTNDSFANATILRTGGMTNEVEKINSLGATAEPGEPEHRIEGAGQAWRSVWFRFDPPGPGRLFLSPNVSAYRGTALTNLVKMQSIVYWGEWFDVRGDDPLYIAFDGIDRDYYDCAFAWGFTPAPAHAQFDDRKAIAGREGRFEEDFAAAVSEIDEPRHVLWRTWQAPADGNLSLMTPGSGVLAQVLRGDSAGTLEPLCPPGERVKAPVQIGETYIIRLTAEPGIAGPLSISFVLDAPPANDRFADAQVLEGAHPRTSGFNHFSNRDPGEPRHAGYWGGASVWYRWRAPSSGPARVWTWRTGLPYGYDAGTAAVYEGDEVQGLTEVASGRLNDGRRVIFQAVEGREYRIAIDGMEGDAAYFDLGLDLGAPERAPTIAVSRQDGFVRIVAEIAEPFPLQIEYSEDLAHWSRLHPVPGQSRVEHMERADFRYPDRPIFFRAVVK